MDFYHLIKILVKVQLRLLKVWAKYSKNLFDSANKSTRDAVKTASKRSIQKPAEATGNWIDNKIADKITRVSKKCSEKLQNED